MREFATKTRGFPFPRPVYCAGEFKAILRKKKVMSVDLQAFSRVSRCERISSVELMTQHFWQGKVVCPDRNVESWARHSCWFTWHRDTTHFITNIQLQLQQLRSWISGVDLSHIDIIEIRSTLYKRKSAISSSYRYRYSNRFEGPMDRWSLHHSHLAGFILRKKSKSPVILSSSKLNTHHFFFT